MHVAWEVVFGRQDGWEASDIAWLFGGVGSILNALARLLALL